MTQDLHLSVPYLAIGGIKALPEGRPTGIYKSPLSGPAAIGPEGLQGDAQADRRVHGGPEKAVHLYPADHYAKLAARFPEAAASLVVGSLGENLSVPGVSEADVCIGDVFAFGSARLQVSQPRSPCWKIDSRHVQEGMAAFIADTGITGWYFRVLEPGQAAPGDSLDLLLRNPDPVSLAEIWRGWQEHRPPPERLARWASTPGLTPDWRRRLEQRLAWLQANSGPAAGKTWHPRPQD